jgi:peptidoglycan hydrolase-like protein with peptidoglycan-binding domain
LDPFTGITRKIAILACASLLIPSLAAAKTTKKAASQPSRPLARASKGRVPRSSSKSSNKKNQAWRNRQKSMDNLRVREIQSALVRDGYLNGEPTGVWDTRSKAAMVKYQQDNGWQSKRVPDSRALIKLGLGADHSNLLNPATASIGQSEPGKGGSPQQ